MKYELLAPAGDFERMETAFRFGADAVYLGGPMLQLRAGSTGFPMDMLARAVEYAHGLNKRIYITVNAFARNEEILPLGEYARALSDMAVDAVIVSDLGVLASIKESAPELQVHISTQANCLNYRAARIYHDLGASRIVLGREMSIDEIAELRALTPPELELEAFVHGAMCMAYSGRCMISAHLTGRSANRGDCTQPCRWNYHLVEEKRPNQFFPVVEDEGGMAILSAYDLNALALLKQLAEAGITCFKIEGRMKSAYYVAAATNAYRRYLDGQMSLDDALYELNGLSHRPYSTGFYIGEKERNISAGAAYQQDCLFVGVVKSCTEDGQILVEQRNRIKSGDELEVLSPNRIGPRFTVTAIHDEEGLPLNEASIPMQRVWMTCNHALSAGDILRRRI